MKAIFFNTQHAPIGAFASFTLGYPGASGGFGLELGRPADQSIYIGLESRAHPGNYEALPFFAEATDRRSDFVHTDQGDRIRWAPVQAISSDRLERTLELHSDTWRSDDLRFTIHRSGFSLPDPVSCEPEELKRALIPAVFAELEIDNTGCDHDRTAFFGYAPQNDTDHIHEPWSLRDAGTIALCNGRNYGIATRAEGADSGIDFAIENILGENDRDRRHFSNGTVGLIDAIIPAGTKRTLQFVLGFHRAGIVTTGFEMRYYYTRFFPTLETVLQYGLEHFEAYREAAIEANQQLDRPDLTATQVFHLAQSVHSYYGSSQLLEHKGAPFWIINEGEYRMINTLDLVADQVFYELAFHPWTLRNVLENFQNHYQYQDEVFPPGDPSKRAPGGVSFAHDMGVMNAFSRPGTSVYERPNLIGCFSFMTHEELVNWTLAALAYTHHHDPAWGRQQSSAFEDMLRSLLARDHPLPEEWRGIMAHESARTVDGAEITTYDSLDASLGAAHGSAYLAVKTWVCYLGLAHFFTALHPDESLVGICRTQATRGARTILATLGPDQTFPAVIHTPEAARIIPIIEGLAFLSYTGGDIVMASEADCQRLLEALRRHLEIVLERGDCLFPDGGWKLSTSTTNSWLSKIYLCQHVARQILGITGSHVSEQADEAHYRWLTDERNSYWAWSDQAYAGVLRGSRYYPRGVTSFLWLVDPGKPLLGSD